LPVPRGPVAGWFPFTTGRIFQNGLSHAVGAGHRSASPMTAAADRATLLDNPIWYALGGDHARFAEGNALARRYTPAVTPLAATRDRSPGALQALARLLGPSGIAGLFVADGFDVIPGFTLIRRGTLTQMVCDAPVPVDRETWIERLTPDDAPAMLELATLTDPGPFMLRSRELGTFLGVRESGRLVAMAGERLRLDGYTEVSAVCTHPSARGRGYAASLVSALIADMAGKGETPFLHVMTSNTTAIRVYERLGFVARRTLELAVIQPA